MFGKYNILYDLANSIASEKSKGQRKGQQERVIAQRRRAVYAGPAWTVISSRSW
jgi:hypothetical protein